MDVGSIAICITIGALIVFASIGIGVCIGNGRSDKGQSVSDSDVRIYVYSRDRNRRGNKLLHRKITEQEMILVLNNLKRVTHGWEQDVVEAIIEEKEGRIQ